jgi:hypothetical protein
MTEFKGLVQHSFALRLADAHQAFDRRSTRETVAERFGTFGDGGCSRFHVAALHDTTVEGATSPAAHTLLVTADPEFTTVKPGPVGVLGDTGEELPLALSWAGPGEDCDPGDPCSRRLAHPRMIFAGFEEKTQQTSVNDFLVETSEPDAEEKRSKRIARSLLEAVAFRRSQLFGLAISNRFVNVMLPCATLTPGDGTGDDRKEPLLLLALVSLMRDGKDRRAFRRMYSLTLYALPVKPGEKEWRARKMDRSEIESLVNAGWGLADAIPQEGVPTYDFHGPLRDYVACLAHPGATNLLARAKTEGTLSLRMVTELITYVVALRMAQGSSGVALDATKRSIGKDVVTTLGTSRVSAVLVVDPDLEPRNVEVPVSNVDPPGSLRRLMKTLSPGVRVPEEWTPDQRRKFRLDRPFVDSNNHAIGVIPANRCLVVTYVRKKFRKDTVPLLSLVAGVTFMTVGAATAIGTLRSIDRDLEELEREDPRKIAEIDDEIATDLHEIYDLDISNETYRNLYRRLRERLGITRDYKTLQDKMQTLYRATSTFHDDREQRQLAWLTAAIVILSVLILIVTIFK